MSTSAAELVKSELESGTWSNHGSAPSIFIIARESKRKYQNEGINLTNEPFDQEFTFVGTPIITDKEVFMEIYARNETDRDNIFEDVKSIFEASSYDLTYRDVHFFDYRNRYRVEMIVRVLM